MSDASGGAGWWLASDGRWYPPETHPSVRALSSPWSPPPVTARAAWPGPSAAAPGPWAPPPAAAGSPPWPPPGAPAGGPARPPPAAPTGPGIQLWEGPGRSPARAQSKTGGYAVLMAVAEAIAVVGCFLPWYALGFIDGQGDQLPAYAKPTAHLLSSADGYGGWRIAVPVAAGLTGLLAVVAVVSITSRAWSPVYAWLVRIGAWGTLGLVIAAMTQRVPDLGLKPQLLTAIQQLGIHFDLGWGAWLTVVAATVAGVLALAVSPRG